MEQLLCMNCQFLLKPTDTVCPKCGSKSRFICVSDSIYMTEGKTCIRNKELYDGSHRYFFEETVKRDYDLDTQQDTMVTRRYNRRVDRKLEEQDYIEEIRTMQGKLIKNKSDKLLNHVGHGCAKKKQDSKNNIDNGDNDA